MFVHCFTYYGAGIFILDVDLPEQSALIVLIHGAWGKKRGGIIIVATKQWKQLLCIHFCKSKTN